MRNVTWRSARCLGTLLEHLPGGVGRCKTVIGTKCGTTTWLDGHPPCIKRGLFPWSDPIHFSISLRPWSRLNPLSAMKISRTYNFQFDGSIFSIEVCLSPSGLKTTGDHFLKTDVVPIFGPVQELHTSLWTEETSSPRIFDWAQKVLEEKRSPLSHLFCNLDFEKFFDPRLEQPYDMINVHAVHAEALPAPLVIEGLNATSYTFSIDARPEYSCREWNDPGRRAYRVSVKGDDADGASSLRDSGAEDADDIRFLSDRWPFISAVVLGSQLSGNDQISLKISVAKEDQNLDDLPVPLTIEVEKAGAEQEMRTAVAV